MRKFGGTLRIEWIASVTGQRSAEPIEISNCRWRRSDRPVRERCDEFGGTFRCGLEESVHGVREVRGEILQMIWTHPKHFLVFALVAPDVILGIAGLSWVEVFEIHVLVADVTGTACPE